MSYISLQISHCHQLDMCCGARGGCSPDMVLPTARSLIKNVITFFPQEKYYTFNFPNVTSLDIKCNIWFINVIPKEHTGQIK